MEKKYLVSETTKEERKEIVKNALGISLLGADMPSDDVLQLAKQYIDGKIEIAFASWRNATELND